MRSAHRRMLSGWIALIWVLGVPAAVAEEPAGEAAPGFVLSESAGRRVAGAFDELKPLLVLDTAQVQKNHVSARLCREGGEPASCVRIRMAHDCEDGSKGRRAGPWCVRVTEGVLSASGWERIEKVFGGMDAEDVWTLPAQKEHRPRINEEVAEDGLPVSSSWGPLLLALLLLVLPLALGGIAGRWVRRIRGPLGPLFTPAVLLLSVVPGVLAVLAVPLLYWFGSWDLIDTGLLLGLGLAVAALRAPAPLDGRALALGLGSLILGLGVVEAGVRFALPPVDSAFEASQARLIFSPEQLDQGCPSLFPDAYPESAAPPRTRSGPELPGYRVLHVGDSMLAPHLVPERIAFSHLLSGLEPGVLHINGGFDGTGPDFQMVIAEAWTRFLPVDLVIMYVNIGNDGNDINHPRACCDGQPLLRRDGGGWRRSCEEPVWSFTRRALFARGAPPYALRVASTFSLAARYGLDLFGRATRALFGVQGGMRPQRLGGSQAAEDVWKEYAWILETLRRDLDRRDTDLLLVVLPPRAALETDHPRDTYQYRMREEVLKLARSKGVRTLDAWGVFEDVVRRDGPLAWFFNYSGYDPHFNERGHRRFARWLDARLREIYPGIARAAGKAAARSASPGGPGSGPGSTSHRADGPER